MLSFESGTYAKLALLKTIQKQDQERIASAPGNGAREIIEKNVGCAYRPVARVCREGSAEIEAVPLHLFCQVLPEDRLVLAA